VDANWFSDPGPEDVGWEGRCNALKGGAGAVKRGTVGERCRMKAGYRTSHEGVGPCCWHGGATPQAARKYERLQAGRLLHGYGLLREGVTDPRDALMEELQRTQGNIDYLTLVLADLSEEELLGVVPLPAELKTGANEEKGEHHELVERFGLPVVVDLYRWERTHLAKLAADAVKLGLLERAVRVEEATAALVAAAVNGALEAAGLPADLALAVKADVVTRLRELEAKPPKA